MELTHTYKGKTNTTTIRTAVGASVVRFIIKHADVFEALARQGQPFGGSLLPTNYTTAVVKAGKSNDPIVDVKQQLDEISRKVASLNNDIQALQATSATKPARNRSGNVHNPDAWRNMIGIDRFRALRQV